MTNRSTDYRALLERALATIERLEAAERARREPIAIVGMACRFPGGVDTPEAFWDLLREGVDAITEVPRSRWNVDEYYDANPDTPGKSYTRWGGFLEDIDRFDAAFFGNAPREAVSMDPQHRLLLEVAWESLERAGHAPARLAGSRTGVFIGLAAMDYVYLQMRNGELSDLDAYFGTGTSHSIAAGRLAYALDLRGPAIAIDTACSSSLVALHVACQSLRAGECDMALGGGVNVMLCPDGSVVTSRARMMSFTGRCHTFDAAADGYVRAEGCALVVLKRLSDAIRDRDTVLAVIRGTALNQDGRSNGLTAPNPQAQEQVIRAALADAGVEPAEVSYVEAHGTGTTLGDPIELRALGAVFAKRPASAPLMVGSVKTNIGHLEAAAGIAGLVKVVLALQHGTIPPHLHLHNPNPYIPWSTLPITVPTKTTRWDASARSTRFAGLSSFGFSGTNAHMVLADAPRAERRTEAAQRPMLLPLSAWTEGALRETLARYAEHLAATEERELPDVCFTAGAGRSHFSERLAMIVSSAEEARAAIAAVRAAQGSNAVLRGTYHKSEPPLVAFMFTGQGAQHAGMGKRLYDSLPVFRREFDRCASILEGSLPRPLAAVVFGEDAGDHALLNETRYTQPALFALEWALAQVWIDWGVRPTAVLGHSVGEYVAACVAGVFTVEDGLRLLAERARLMGALPRGGAMASIMAPTATVESALQGRAGVAIAAINGPTSTVISGVESEVAAVADGFQRKGIATRRLDVSHAFHSPLMEPVLAEFIEAARGIAFGSPEIDLIVNVTGDVADAKVTTPDYWAKHIREPVQFERSIKTLHGLGYRRCVEIGPSAVLAAMAPQCIAADDVTWVPSLRRGGDDMREMLRAAATLYVQGTNLHWEALDSSATARRVVLPTYPFERTRYWLPLRGRTARNRGGAESHHPLLGERLRSPELANSVYQAHVSAAAPAFIADHCVFGKTVLPAAAFFDMAVTAGRDVAGGPVSLVDATIREPLALEDGETRSIQTVLERAGGDEYELHIHSAPLGTDQWRTHVTARVRATAADALAREFLGLEPSAARDELDPDKYYSATQAAGVAFGPQFRLLRDIRIGRASASAEIDVSRADDVNRYAIHPSFLDAAFQLAGVALNGAGFSGDKPIYLPIAVEKLEVFAPAASELTAVTRVRPTRQGAEVVIADVEIRSDKAVAVRLEGLKFKRATAVALRRAAQRADQLYLVDWEEVDDVLSPISGRRRWLVVQDSPRPGAELLELLQARGDEVHLVVLPSSDRPGNWAATIADAAPFTDVLYFASAEVAEAPDDGQAIEQVSRSGCVQLIRLLQVIATSPEPPRLNVVTQGAQPVGVATERLVLAQAPLWGLLRTIRNEHPALQSQLIDLPLERAGVAAERERLLALIDDSRRTDWQVALRDGKRFAPRLRRPEAADESASGLQPPNAADFGLAITQRGVLDNLRLEALDLAPPGRGEVQIEVAASGLNFRDVLSALNMYPGEPGPLGGEVAGTVVAVGDGVRDFAVGDEVMALSPRGFCTRVNTSALLACKRPAAMSMIDAAAMPVVFQTAYYALHEVARLRRNERILIHAGAGGVGLAAIQLAREIGAEIFATAGSEHKRGLLRSLGVRHVMDSRSLAFADEVHAETGGEGVDVVLNSLADDFIPRSLELLRRGGRFVELGKTDLWNAERVRQINPTASYTPVYLGDLCIASPELIHRMFAELAELIERGAVRPLPVRTFALDRSADAFRYMAQARHVGKIVIERQTDAERPTVRRDGAYIVTGGLGGVGLHIARWLAAAGAGRIVLAGRKAASEAAEQALARLRVTDTDIIVEQADVADPRDVLGLVQCAERGGLALRGIVHAAGVLDDGVVLQMDDERFARVFTPKIRGGMNVLRAARHKPLDFLVFCSAGAALFGAPGQGNYAAANAFLDVLAAYARGLGVPAVSVDWGAWRDTGMMTGVSLRDQQRWSRDGMKQLEPAAALQALERLLRLPAAQAAVLDVDWSLASGSGMIDALPLVRRLARQAEPAAAAASGPTRATQRNVYRELEALPSKEREEHLTGYLREQVRVVLGLPAGAVVRPDRGFTELGMDSLMSVELANRLRVSLDCSLPATLAFEHPNLAQLVTHLLTLMGMVDHGTHKMVAGTDSAERRRDDLPPEMSPDQASAALLAELDQIGY
jgi:acyl transferase domain-containing protein/acyl carrier protein